MQGRMIDKQADHIHHVMSDSPLRRSGPCYTRRRGILEGRGATVSDLRESSSGGFTATRPPAPLASFKRLPPKPPVYREHRQGKRTSHSNTLSEPAALSPCITGDGAETLQVGHENNTWITVAMKYALFARKKLDRMLVTHLDLGSFKMPRITS